MPKNKIKPRLHLAAEPPPSENKSGKNQTKLTNSQFASFQIECMRCFTLNRNLVPNIFQLEPIGSLIKFGGPTRRSLIETRLQLETGHNFLCRRFLQNQIESASVKFKTR